MELLGHHQEQGLESSWWFNQQDKPTQFSPKEARGNYPMEPPSIKQMVLDSSMEPIPKYKCFNTKTDHFTYANWMHF